MGEFGKSPASFVEIQPPHMVALEDGNTALLTPLDSHVIDVRYLLPPLEIIDHAPEESIPEQARALRNAYIDLSEVSFAAIWHETENFVASAASVNQVDLGADTLFNTHLAYDELMQNAFRHGGQPQRLWTSLVLANEIHPGAEIPALPINTGVPPQLPTMTSYRILLGVQDTNPRWNQPPEVSDEVLVENFRGLDLVRGVSRAVWHRQDEGVESKWVWALI
jgi:hypothetical protein